MAFEDQHINVKQFDDGWQCGVKLLPWNPNAILVNCVENAS